VSPSEIPAVGDADDAVDVQPAHESADRDGREARRALGEEYRRAMGSGDSVFTPGKPVWTLANARELKRTFVDRPDTGDRSFDEKLNDQLTGVSDTALQLFAEIWCLNLVPLADYKPSSKRGLLMGVIRRMTAPIELSSSVLEALQGGAFNGGVAFKTRRSFQLALLVEITSALLELSDSERTTAMSDPLAFGAVVASVSQPKEPAQRCALRWFLFPDYYLPIVSVDHRRSVRSAFSHLLDGSEADLDAELDAIRTALAEELGGEVDFYSPEILEIWDPSRVISGHPPTLETIRSRSEYKSRRYVIASWAIGTINEGEWTTYTDVGTVAGLHPGHVGGYIKDIPHDAGHRVIKLDGTTYTSEGRIALEAEGVVFDERGVADPQCRVEASEIRRRLDEQGVQYTTRRAWLVRGNNVGGRDLVPGWLADGHVTLAATNLRRVDPGISHEDLKVIVDEDYGHASYAARAEKLDEFFIFLSRVQPGNLVVTIDQGRLHIGEVVGEAEFESSSDSDARFIRTVEWQGDTSVAELPGELAARLKVQRDVLDLTQQIDAIEKLLAPHDGAPDEAVLTLPDATDELAESLHVDCDWLQECIELLRDRPQMIFYGPPGTGKTYIAQELATHLAGDNVRMVQFHPSYSYEDFFEGFRPTSEGGFELRPGPMRRVVDQALDNPGQAHVVIIDEINRGNLAKIFGELYFLLEYRDRNVELLYGDGDFSLPGNVFIIGTMNTADRSIALVDAAMRRRFAFVALHPSEAPTDDVLRRWLKATERPARVANLLKALNARIDDPDFRIGPSYFMRDAVYEAGGLERVWRHSIVPLLEEHHYGEMDREAIEVRYGYDAIAKGVDGVTDTDDAPSVSD